jgi:hypothetical protein
MSLTIYKLVVFWWKEVPSLNISILILFYKINDRASFEQFISSFRVMLFAL